MKIKEYKYNYLLIIASLLIFVFRIIMALNSEMPLKTRNLSSWIEGKLFVFRLADEFLTFGLFLFSIAFFILILSKMNKRSLLYIATLISLLFIIIAYLLIVLKLGNLVYPVNGITIPGFAGCKFFHLLVERFREWILLSFKPVVINFLRKGLITSFPGMIPGR